MPQVDENTPARAEEALVFLGKYENGDIQVDVTVRMDDGSEVKAARRVPATEIMEPGKTMKANLTVDVE